MKLMVPYVAGGGSDQRARLAAKYLEKHVGEKIEVVNRTGAVVGHTAIASAPADGSVIGLITGEIGMMHWHTGLTSLTPRDYTPLAVPYVESAAVVVAASAPWRSAREFLDEFGKRKVMGSGGPHFGVWKFALAGLLDVAGIPTSQLEWTETLSGEQGLEHVLAGRADMAGIPHKGGGNVVAALLGGEIDVTKIGMGNISGQLNSGKVKVLAIQGSQRSKIVPAVPTMAEAGLGAFPLRVWWSLVMSADAPEAAVKRINAEFVKLYREPRMAEYLESQFVEVAVASPQEFGAFLASERQRAPEIVKAFNIPRQ